MKNRRNMRDAYWMLGTGILALALLAVFLHFRRPIELQIELQNELVSAIDKGQSDKARTLLSQGVDPTKMPNPALGLISAVIYCDPATVQAVIKKGVDVNGKIDAGLTALHYAIIHRRSDMVEVLLKNGADVWIKKADGDTALDAMAKPAHKFARHDNDPKILRLLREAEKKTKN